MTSNPVKPRRKVPGLRAGVVVLPGGLLSPAPGEDGSLALGTWQAIFFCEFDGPRERSLHVSVLG